MEKLLVSFYETIPHGAGFLRIAQVRNELNNCGYIKCYDTNYIHSPLSDLVVWQKSCLLEDLYKLDGDQVHVMDLDDSIWHLPEYLNIEGDKCKDKHESMLNEYKLFMSRCDYMTTTTDFLADVITQQTGFPRNKIHVIPNYLNINALPFGRKSVDGIVRIAWTLDFRRRDVDIMPAQEALLEILSQYKGRVRIIFFGDCPTAFKGLNCVDFVPFNNDMHGYYKTLSQTNIDIGICPAIDSMFNHCKSELKPTEFGAIGCPVVASPIVPYTKSKLASNLIIADGNKEWKDALCYLIDNKQARLNAGFELHEVVKENYNLHNEGLNHYYQTYYGMIKSNKKKNQYTVNTGLDNSKKKILYCTSSRTKESLQKIKDNVLKNSVFYDINVIMSLNNGEHSLADVFNTVTGNNKDVDIFIFAHDDIEIIDKNWLHKVVDGLKKYDIVAACGSTLFNPMHGMWSPELNGLISGGCVAHPLKNGKFSFTNYGVDKDILTFDGCFVAMRGDVARDIPWKAYNKFHFYDIAFGIDANRKGYKVGVCPIGIKHLSEGNYGKEWADALKKFRMDYGTKVIRLNKEVSKIKIYTCESDEISHAYMMESLMSQSMLCEHEPYRGVMTNPSVLIDRPVVFTITAIEVLDRILKLNLYGRIKFKVSDYEYVLEIDDRDTEYNVKYQLGFDYCEEFNYVHHN